MINNHFPTVFGVLVVLAALAAPANAAEVDARSAGAASTSPPNGVALCQICHQQNFLGGPTAPRLAGQSYEYLVEAMRSFAEGKRTSSSVTVPMLQRNAEMVKIMEAISPAER